MDKGKSVSMEITEQEQQVIRLIRDLGYGELLICVREGRPFRVEEIRKSIQIR